MSIDTHESTKRKISILVDKNVIEKAHELGLNVSKFAENALKDGIKALTEAKQNKPPFSTEPFLPEKGHAGPVGFEPTISGSEGRHLNPC
jgi:post-segregation antitoxin (ccd killing protein)